MTVDPADGTLTELMPPTGHGDDGNAITTVPPQLLGTSTVAAIAGVWYWAPKILGTTLPEGQGRLVVCRLFLL